MQPNVLNLRYLKLWILLDQIIYGSLKNQFCKFIIIYFNKMFKQTDNVNSDKSRISFLGHILNWNSFNWTKIVPYLIKCIENKSVRQRLVISFKGTEFLPHSGLGSIWIRTGPTLLPASVMCQPDSILCRLGFNFDGAARLFTVPGLP